MPSDELSDEIEALNSIYGDGTLSPSTSSDAVDVYVLVLPAEDTDGGAASSDLAARAALRLYIPPSYPSSEPPSVLATHSAGAHAKPGAAAHALTLFRAALAETYTPGEVCLFDAIEDFSQRMQASAPDAAAPASRTPVLKLLQMMDVWDVMVVVTRWYGGQKLGPRRFAVINMVARQAVVRLVGEAAGGGGGGKGGKK
ncbi:hypothetical protein VdG1_02245 [Verticillium dahliae VDG1]|nr:hypothetical protein VdG1_02245 [Verticillium dahliae VDG1]